MDHRTPLKLHTVLAFEGMDCFVEEIIGQGFNAIVYKGWYPDKLNPDLRHHVLIKELFPFYPEQKIWRNEDNCIIVESEAEDHWNTHKESFLAGNDVHLRLLADHPDMVGGNLNGFRANGTLYSILGYSGGRSLQADLNASGHDLRRHARLMLRLLDALEAFHKSGYLHLDISPDNIMLVGNGENERIFLIDFNSAHVIGANDHAYLSSKPGYSAPEVKIGDRDGIDFPSDLYSVAAVFYRCLMDRTLTLEETLQDKAPDGKESSYLKNMPETVVSMVGRILKKGLHTLPEERYRSIGQMRRAFAELIDRIDCVGVTHWSLWENGKRSVEELIRINPSLRYVKETNKLYPIRLKSEESSISLPRHLQDTLSVEGRSSLIVAQGGMGKTTLLLHTAMLHSKHYSSSTPAVFYISLNSWNGKDAHYIQNQILMSLRFKQDMNNYNSARHTLQQLLNQPLKTRVGEIPTVLLLLDGLNEIHGDTAALVREINELSKLAGVRIIATSRNEIPALELQTARLIPLEVEDIESALGRNGLLIPRKQNVLQLLRTPLVLSIYIQASEAGKQLDIETEEELMRVYMDALLQKELKQLPEESPEKWQIDVALNYVLPAIAAEVKRAGHALMEQQMLKVVENCRKTLRSPLLKRVFPQWIGHTKDIFGDSKTVDEWLGIIIYTILHQRLGLLMKDEDNRYRVFHQQMGEYLATQTNDIARRILIRRVAVAVIALIAVFCLGTVGAHYYRVENTYDDELVEKAILYGTEEYVSLLTLHEEVQTLISHARKSDVEAFLQQWDVVQEKLNSEKEESIARIYFMERLEREFRERPNGFLVWSDQPYSGSLALEMIGYTDKRISFYRDNLHSLYSLLTEYADPDLEIVEDWQKLMNYELAVAKELQYQSCFVYDDDMNDSLKEEFYEVLRTPHVGELNVYSRSRTEDSEDILENAQNMLASAENIVSVKSTKETLRNALLEPLKMYEQMYAEWKWASKYVQDYVDDPTWENLLKARAACSAARESYQDYSQIDTDFTQYQFRVFMDEGIDAEDLVVFLDDTKEKESGHIQVAELFLHLDFCFLDCEDRITEYLTLVDKIFEYNATEYWLLANKLLLQIDEYSFFEELSKQLPTLSVDQHDWIDDADQLEFEWSEHLEAAESIQQEYDSFYHKYVTNILAHVNDISQLGAYHLHSYYRPNFDISEIASDLWSVSNVPCYIPYPYWITFEDIYNWTYAYGGSGVNRVSTCEAIGDPVDSISLTCDGISIDDAQLYKETLTKYGFEIQEKTVNEDSLSGYFSAKRGECEILVRWSSTETYLELGYPTACMVLEPLLEVLDNQ